MRASSRSSVRQSSRTGCEHVDHDGAFRADVHLVRDVRRYPPGAAGLQAACLVADAEAHRAAKHHPELLVVVAGAPARPCPGRAPRLRGRRARRRSTARRRRPRSRTARARRGRRGCSRRRGYLRGRLGGRWSRSDPSAPTRSRFCATCSTRRSRGTRRGVCRRRRCSFASRSSRCSTRAGAVRATPASSPRSTDDRSDWSGTASSRRRSTVRASWTRRRQRSRSPSSTGSAAAASARRSWRPCTRMRVRTAWSGSRSASTTTTRRGGSTSGSATSRSARRREDGSRPVIGSSRGASCPAAADR